MRIDFASSERSSVGIEWELALVDRDTGDLVQVADEVLEAVGSGDGSEHPQITHELLLNTIELVSGVHHSVPDAVADLQGLIDLVRTVTDEMDVELMCAGTHPFAQWFDQRSTQSERYDHLLERTQWWGRQMLIWGVHVHVGVRREQVIPIVTSLLNWYPHLQALSASSPIWAGTDTGYASNRPMMFQQLPTAGLPFQFECWEEFESYAHDLLKTGVIEVIDEIRWDIRPAPRTGTVEVRVCDGVSTLWEMRALVALTHCLVVDLSERLDRGERLPTMPPWHVQENKWRAARYGLDAWIILDDQSNERLLLDDLDDLLERLQPVAERLRCVDDLALVREIPRRGASYQRQRQVAESTDGDLVAVVDSVVREL